MCICRHGKGADAKGGENWENVCPLKSPSPPIPFIDFCCFLNFILCKQNLTMKLLTSSLQINPSYIKNWGESNAKVHFGKTLTTYFWVPGDV